MREHLQEDGADVANVDEAGLRMLLVGIFGDWGSSNLPGFHSSSKRLE